MTSWRFNDEFQQPFEYTYTERQKILSSMMAMQYKHILPKKYQKQPPMFKRIYSH